MTGGSGFIGTNLVQSLCDTGDAVLSIDTAQPLNAAHRSHWLETSLEDSASALATIRAFAPDHVVSCCKNRCRRKKRLAAYSTNFDGTDRLMDLIAGVDGIQRVIFTSTMMVTALGHSPSSDSDYCPHTLYGESKALMEQHIRKRDPAYEWCFIRPVSIWGPYMQAHYRAFFELVAKGRFFDVGRPGALRSLGFVGNVVHQIRALLRAPAPSIHRRVFYVGDDRPTYLADWAECVRSETGASAIPCIPVSLAKMVARLGDAARAVGIPSPLYTFRLRNLTTDGSFPCNQRSTLRVLLHSVLKLASGSQWRG